MKYNIFSKSKPSFIRKFFNGFSWWKTTIIIICCVLLISGIWGGSVLFNQKVPINGTYPVSKRQKNDVKKMLNYVQTNLAVLDTMYFTYENTLKDCENYLLNPTASSYQSIVSQLNDARSTLKKQSSQAVPLSKKLSKTISKTNINISHFTELSKIPNKLFLQYDDAIDFLQYSMNPDKPFDNTVRHRIVEFNRDLLQLEAQSVFLRTCELLLPVDESELEDFKTKVLPSLNVISKNIQLWSRNEASLKKQQENIEAQQQSTIIKYVLYEGNTSKDFLAQKHALINLLTQSGMTKKEAENFIDKFLCNNQYLDNEKNKLEIHNKKLEDLKQLAREKFAPRETDDPLLVWSKALRFLTIDMYDDAINAFQFYMNMVKDTDSEASIYIPAVINFVKNINNTGINYGILVKGYELGKPNNPFYKVGDVIIAVNKTTCKNINDYSRIKESIPANSSFTVTIMRADETGTLKIIDVQMPPGQSKVAMIDLTESD